LKNNLNTSLLRRLNKALSRKEKGSNNRYQARIKLAKQHAKVAAIRQDNLHKTTTQLIQENQTIVCGCWNWFAVEAKGGKKR
jgi:transposase